MKLLVLHVAKDLLGDLIFLPAGTTLHDVAVLVTAAGVVPTHHGLGSDPVLKVVDALILLLL